MLDPKAAYSPEMWKKNITCESNQNPYAAAGSILSGWLDKNNHLGN